MRKEIFNEFRGAMACVEVKLPNGDISNGSAFHIGEGVFITAKHVVEGYEILSITTTEIYYEPDENGNTTISGKEGKFRRITSQTLSLKSGPYFHPNNDIDIAAFVVNETDIKIIQLGGHLDDWINDSDFVLMETIVLGYPPIPFSKKPVLFAATSEINAVIDRYNGPHPHFIISVMPRGGFSGGVCLVGDCALGVIVESLNTNYRETELGYLTVLSVEPIFTCLQAHKLLPEIQKDGWEGLWDNKNPLDSQNTFDSDQPFE